MSIFKSIFNFIFGPFFDNQPMFIIVEDNFNNTNSYTYPGTNQILDDNDNDDDDIDFITNPVYSSWPENISHFKHNNNAFDDTFNLHNQTDDMFDHSNDLFDNTTDLFDHTNDLFDHTNDMFDHTNDF